MYNECQIACTMNAGGSRLRKLPLLALLVVSAFWGGHAVVGKVAEAHLGTLSLTVWRFTFGALCYIPFWHKLNRIFRLPKKEFWLLAVSGVCFAVLFPLFFYQSLLFLSPVVGLILINSSPLLAALFGWFIFRERLSIWQWLGIGISFAGVFVLILNGGTGRISFVGIGFAMVAAAAFAMYTVLSKPLFRSLPLLDVLIGTSFWGAGILWIIVLVSGQFHHVVTALSGLQISSWVQFLYIVFIVSTLAYALYGYGLMHLPSGIASAVTFYPQVIFAALLQWIWLGIIPTLATFISALCILSGTAFMGRRKRI